MQFSLLISICAGFVCWAAAGWCLLLLFLLLYCCCSCFIGMRRFFSFFCYSLSLPSSSGSVIITMLQYFCYFFFIFAIHLFHWKIHIFWFCAHQIQQLCFGFNFCFNKISVDSDTYWHNHFIRESVCLLSIWFNFKQFLNRKKLQWTKTPQFVTLYLLYLSIQYVCIK